MKEGRKVGRKERERKKNKKRKKITRFKKNMDAVRKFKVARWAQFNFSKHKTSGYIIYKRLSN